MARNKTEDATVGEDSFLDTTANLVGILIILVVVIGAKTKIEADEYTRKIADKDLTEQLEQPAQKALAMQGSLQKQAINLQEYELETVFRQQERDRLLLQVKIAEESVDEKLNDLDEEKRSAVEQQRKIESLKSELDKTFENIGSPEESKRPKVILEHLPTPMARTVFTREMHVKLQNDRITLIPWDRLVDVLKEQAPLAIRRHASKQLLEETLGPIGGFLMQYRMTAVPGGFELESFEIEATSEVLAETLNESFETAGRLQLELATRNPSETVITVWVYPESFGAFRELKNRLFEQGFLCAARPLPEGVRIGASPQGTRSSAQ